MKKVLLIVALLIISTTVIFAAQPTKGVGVGLTTGFPIHVGPQVEYNFGPATAYLALGYQSHGGNYFFLRVGGDYNFQSPFINNNWKTDIYLSVGGQFDMAFTKGGNDIMIGVPVTWSWHTEKVPIKVFAKAGPSVIISTVKYTWLGTTTTDTSAGLGFVGSIGALYYFDI
jgi:hypothetical protein